MASNDNVSEQAAALVAYEYRTMLATAEALETIDLEVTDSEYDEGWELQERVYLEAFLVHYRNLLDFLSPRKKKLDPRDITAGPFLGKPQDHRLQGVPNDYRDAIDKRLSHLSTARGNGQHDWPGSTMRDRLRVSYEAFLNLLMDERKRWFTHPRQVVKQRRPGFYRS